MTCHCEELMSTDSTSIGRVYQTLNFHSIQELFFKVNLALENPKCMDCSKVVPGIVKNNIAKDLIGQMQVKCLNEGCSHVGTLEHLQDHLILCYVLNKTKRPKHNTLSPDGICWIDKLHVIHKFLPYSRLNNKSVPLIEVMHKHRKKTTDITINHYFKFYYAPYFENVAEA